MLWEIAFLLKDSTLINIISKLKYFVFIKVKEYIQNDIISIVKVKSMSLLSWPSNHFCKKASRNSKWVNSQIKSNTTPKHLCAFIMYEQHLILIKLPLNALILLTTGEIVGWEWKGWWEYELILLVSFLKEETSRWPRAMLFLVIYFCASLMMPTVRKLHPQGHCEHASRGLIPVTEKIKGNALLPQKWGERTLAFSMQWFLSFWFVACSQSPILKILSA